METFQLYFELIGAVAFAISGAALGIRKGMDLFGVAMLGINEGAHFYRIAHAVTLDDVTAYLRGLLEQ